MDTKPQVRFGYYARVRGSSPFREEFSCMNRRQADILELFQTSRELTVTALAAKFQVTPATIRRDFQFLEDEGHLTRAHGSAILSPGSANQLAFTQRSLHFASQKRAIARAVAAEICPGMTVSLDTGTTTLEVAKALRQLKNIRVLTASLPIAAVLHGQENLEVILMGGTMRHTDLGLSGSLTEENLHRFRADVAVLGAAAVARDGVFTTDLAAVRGTQAMLAGATKRLLAIDSHKFGARGLYRYAHWDDFAEIYTDTGISAEDRSWLKQVAPAVTFVPPEIQAPAADAPTKAPRATP